MWNHQQTSGEYTSGDCICRKIQRRKVIPDQCAYEPQIIRKNICNTGKDTDYNINEALYLVDLPGYGYAKVSEQEKIKWGQLIERYLHGSKQLKVVFLLIDIRHKPSGNDKMMYEWIVSQGFHPVIIATKLDKIKRSQKDKQIKIVKEGLGVLPGTIVIPFSSVTKQGRDEIWELVERNYLNTQENEE